MTFLPDWPPVRGEYATGDPNRQVAIITLASELDKNRLVKKSAIVGTMKTENIGIEKVVAIHDDLSNCASVSKYIIG